MIRVDAHQHFWHFHEAEYPWIGPQMRALRRNLLPEELHFELEREAIDASIAVQARTTPAETDYLLGMAASRIWIAGVIGWVELQAQDLDARLERWQDQPKLRGFRHTLQDEPDAAAYMNSPHFLASLEHLQSEGYVYEVLVRQPQLPAAVALCAQRDRHWLVLDHLGKPAIRDHAHAHWARSIAPLRHMPHVVCKLSGLVTEADGGASFVDEDIWPYLDTALDTFGAERLAYGSDWPVCLMSASYARVHGIVRDWARKLSSHEQAELFGGTAARTYGIV